MDSKGVRPPGTYPAEVRKKMRKLSPHGADATQMSWDQVIQLGEFVFKYRYGMRFDGGTFYGTIAQMVREAPGSANVVTDALQVNCWDVKTLYAEGEAELVRLLVQYNYIQAGKKVFYVYEDVLSMLRDTELPAIPFSELKFPFEAFCVKFRRGLLDDGSGAGAVFDRVFITCPDGKNFSGMIGSEVAATSPVFYSAVNADTLLNDAVVDDDTALPGYNALSHSVARLCVNLLLYLNCDNADVCRDTTEADALQQKVAACKKVKGKKTRAQKHLEKCLGEARNHAIYLVGKSVRADASYGVHASNEEGRKILKRFRVRGHFRNQPHGPERSLVKRKWVAPYWKGPDMAELINNGYVVKK